MQIENNQQLENTIKQIFNDTIQTSQIQRIEEIIQILSIYTDENNIINPFVQTDGTLWHQVAIDYLNKNLPFQALQILERYYEHLLNLQDKRAKRIHKGAQLFFIGLLNYIIGDYEKSKKYFLLDFAEDVILDYENEKGIQNQIKNRGGVFQTPCYIQIKKLNFYKDEDLRDLYEFIYDYLEAKPIPFYPDELILKWNIHRLKNKEIIITRGIEDVAFDINLRYYDELLENIDSDPSGINFEMLATYLFSCINQFEVIPQKGTESYHFDLLIRNLLSSDLSFRIFGEYLGVECKNIKKTVSVGQMNHFIQKLRFHNLKCGIIFTIKGISGYKYKKFKYAKAIQIKTYNRDGIIVFDINRKDLDFIKSGYNLLSVLLKKYEDIRFS